MFPPRAHFVASAVAALLLAAAHAQDVCDVPFRNASSLSESQVLEVATLAFKTACAFGTFPALQVSRDPLCYRDEETEDKEGRKSCSYVRRDCQRLVGSDGSAVLAVGNNRFAAPGVYYAKDGLAFQETLLAEGDKNATLVGDWAKDSAGGKTQVTVECARDYDISIKGVNPAGQTNLCSCPGVCMTAETLAHVTHIKLRKYEGREVLCHAGNCMTSQHNVLYRDGFQTMQEYCRQRSCTRETADVYKAVVLGFTSRGGVVLSMVYGTGLERGATVLLQLAVWALSIAAFVAVYYVVFSFAAKRAMLKPSRPW